MAPGNGVPKTREELQKKVDDLLALQTDYLRKSLRIMGFTEEEIGSEVSFFMLRKAHYLKVAEEKFALTAH